MATMIPAEYPAEETHPGVALQRVNAINPRSGKFSHQIVYLGTEKQARALAAIGFYQRLGAQTGATYNHLYAIINGLGPQESADEESADAEPADAE